MSIEKAFISDRAELTILEFLTDEVSLSKKKLKDCLFKGGIWLQRDKNEPLRLREPQYEIKEGDEIHIYYDEDYLKLPSPRLQLIQQEQDISLWQKPDGISEAASLFSDHLNLSQVIERSLPKQLDCHLIYPIIAYCSTPILIAHSRRCASQLQQWVDKQSININLKGRANQKLFEFLEESLDKHNIKLTVTARAEQKSPKLQHTSGTCEFEIINISNAKEVEAINLVFLEAFEEYDDGRSTVRVTKLAHPEISSI